VKLQDILARNQILVDLKVADKNDLISTMGRFLASTNDLSDPDLIIRKLLEREADMTTGIGHGIAIPHARIDGINRLYLVAARCVEGIEYQALDEQPVRLVFMMISPSNTTTEHRQVLSVLSKIMSSEQVRADLTAATTADQFRAILVNGENACASQ